MSSAAVFRLQLSFIAVSLLAVAALGAPPAPHPVEARVRQLFPAVNLDSAARFEDAAVFAGGELRSGLRTRADATRPSTLSVIHPRTYDGDVVAELGGMRVVLRAPAAASAPVAESNGTLVYTEAFRATHAIEVAGSRGPEELLLLDDATAPRTFEWEIVAADGVAAVTIESGTVRFWPAAIQDGPPARGMQIDAPWTLASRPGAVARAAWSLVGGDAIPSNAIGAESAPVW